MKIVLSMCADNKKKLTHMRTLKKINCCQLLMFELNYYANYTLV